MKKLICIGGGNIRHLVEQLKTTNIDKLLIKAYNNGIVCAGISAGSYCRFKYNYDLIEGMNVINAVNCVHCDQKDISAKDKFYNLIKDNNLIGYAIDNCFALEFLDDNIKVVKSNFDKNAYKVNYINNKIDEKIM